MTSSLAVRREAVRGLILLMTLSVGFGTSRAGQGSRSNPQDAGLEGAIQAFEQSNLARAQALLRDYLASHPKSAAAWNLQGLLYDTQRRFEEGERALQSALTLEPSAAVYNNLGNHALLVGRPEEAVKDFRAALRLDPHHLSARLNLVSLLVQGRGCAPSAELGTDASPAEVPSRACAEQSLAFWNGFSPKEQQQPEIQLLHVRALLAAEQSSRALDAAKLALRTSQHSSKLASALGGEFLQAGEARDAVAILEQTLTAKPKLKQDFAFRLELASAKFQAQAPARADFLELVKLNPHAWQPYYYLGRLASASKQYLEASTWLVKAQQLAPQVPSIAAALANAAAAQGFWLDAEDEWQRYVRLKPDDLRAYRELAIVATMGKQRDLGLSSMERYVTAFPGDAEAQYMITLMYQDVGRQEDVRAALAKSLQLKPANPAAWVTLARIEMSENNPDDAQKHLEHAIELDPRYVEALVTLAQLHARRRHPELALPLLERAVRLDPRNLTAHYQLVQAYRRTGDKQLAAEEEEAFERLQALRSPVEGGRGLLSYLRGDVGLSPEQRREHYVEFLRSALATHPGDPRVLSRLAIAELASGQPTAATNLFREALAQPSLAYRDALDAAQALEGASNTDLALEFYTRALAAPEAATDARAALAQARLLARLAKLKEALAVVSAVPAQAEPNGQAADLAGLIYARQNNDIKAQAAFQVALRLAPHDETIHRDAALFLASRGQWLAAVKLLDAAGEQLPARISINIYKAVLLQLSGRQKEAQAVLAELAFHGDDPSLSSDERLAGLLLAISYYTSDQKAAAARLLEELTHADASLAQAWYYRALIASETDQSQRALDWVSRSIALENSYAPALYLRGKLLMERHRLDDAARDLEAAAKADLSWSPPHYLLARIYLSRGEKVRAGKEQRQVDQLRAQAQQQASPSSALRAYLDQLPPGPQPY